MPPNVVHSTTERGEPTAHDHPRRRGQALRRALPWELHWALGRGCGGRRRERAADVGGDARLDLPEHLPGLGEAAPGLVPPG